MKNIQSNSNEEKKFKISLTEILVMIIMACGLLFVWYYLVSKDEETIFNNKKNELLAIADLKVNQIVSWRKERIADAEVIGNNIHLKKVLNGYLKNNIRKNDEAEIGAWFKTIKEMYDYENVYLYGADEKIKINVNTNNVFCPFNKLLIDSARKTKKILFSDFHKDYNSDIHLSLVIPLFIRNKINESYTGSVVLVINPKKFIYPLIQSWPIPSKSSESLLLERAGDSIVFLNELRFTKNTAMILKFSIKDTNILAVKAAGEGSGVKDGIDYRDIKVVGAVRSIPNSPWFIVAKTDWDEIYYPLHERKLISISIILILLIGMVLAFRLYWVRQQASFFRKNYDTILEKQVVLRTLQGIIESTDDLIYSLDTKYCYSSFNQNHASFMKKVYGVDIKVGNNILEYISIIDERTKAKTNIDLALSGIRIIEESYLREEPPVLLDYEVTYNPIKDSIGKVVGVSVYAKNVTERKKIAESLWLKNLVFDSSISANSIADIKGNINQLNPSFLRLWRLSNAEEVVGKPISYFMYNTEETEAIMNALNSNGKWSGEFVAKRKDGSTFYAEGLATIVKDLYGNLIGYQSSVMDITERRLAEDALRENERVLKEVQDLAHMGSWFWDVKTGDVSWSEETYKIFQLDSNNFSPQIDSILALSPWPGDHERGQELINRAIESHSPGVYEQRFLRPNNSIGYYVSTFKGNYDENGELVSIIGSVLDITERKITEEALRESEEKFRNIFEYAAVGKSITFMDGKIKTNEAFKNILGYSEEDLSILKWQDITHPVDLTNDLEIINSIINNERTSARWKKRYIHKNGSIVWVDISTVLQRDSSGEPIYFITSIIDITAEILAQEKLRRSKERFVRAMDNIPDVIVIYDKELRILYINNSTKNVTGHNIADFLGKKDEEVWPPEIYQLYLPSLQEALRTKEVTSVDTEIMFDGYGMKSLHIICVPVLDDKNEILEIIGITHDYTERKHAEDSIRVRDQLLVYEQTKLKTLLDISSGIYLANSFKDIGRTISNVLENYRIGTAIGIKLAIYDAEEDLYEIVYLSGEDDEKQNKLFTYLVKPCSLNEVMYYSKIAIEQKRTLYIEDNYSEYSLNIDIRQKDLVNSCMLFIPLFNGDVLIGLLSFARSPKNSMDQEFIMFLENSAKHACTAIGKLLNEKKKKKVELEIFKLNEDLEKRVIERTAKLESANRDLESFSYSVSHDLRAPLRAINGFAQILVNRYNENLNEEGLHYLDNIIEASDRMSKLIEDILYYSRLGRKSVLLSPVDLNEIMSKILSDYQNILLESKSKIVIPDVLPIIESDKTLLRLIIMNLLDNAIKYSKKNIPNKIIVEYFDEGKEHLIRIIDNGIGMDDEYKEKIFDVFQRLHSEDEYPGTGIGLAIVKKSAEMLKGTVYLEKSVIDEGSTFIIKLPKE